MRHLNFRPYLYKQTLGFISLPVKKPHFILIGNENEEWEAELEGELNEFEMVNSKDGRGEDDPEWENQIQQMLDAEESTN